MYLTVANGSLAERARKPECLRGRISHVAPQYTLAGVVYEEACIGEGHACGDYCARLLAAAFANVRCSP